MDISFILLTWNSEKYIEKCLNSVLTDLESSPYSYEVRIADNGSQDRTPDLLKSVAAAYPDRIFPVFLTNNTGTTFPRNLMFKQAAGDYIAVMDSDVEVTPGAIGALIKTLNENSDVGLVAPRLVYPSGHFQKSADQFPTVLSKLYRYFFLKRMERQADLPNGTLEEPDYVISACWVFRKELLKTVGYLDENIFYSPEDVDFCLRIWKAGYRILYNPSAACIHHAQEISRGFKLNKAAISHAAGLLYYFKKHRYFLRKPVFSRYNRKETNRCGTQS